MMHRNTYSCQSHQNILACGLLNGCQESLLLSWHILIDWCTMSKFSDFKLSLRPSQAQSGLQTYSIGLSMCMPHTRGLVPKGIHPQSSLSIQVDPYVLQTNGRGVGAGLHPHQTSQNQMHFSCSGGRHWRIFIQSLSHTRFFTRVIWHQPQEVSVISHTLQIRNWRQKGFRNLPSW